MQVDIAGRVKNLNLSPSKTLLPLFEAVVNSIHAIEDAKITNGLIEISLIRDNSQLPLLDNHNLPKITGFHIKDNGIGFNEKNYKSFCTSDTTLKAKRVSKGIGRFLWLKVFGSIEIESVYCESNKYYHRRFQFVNLDDGIQEHENLESDQSETFTIIKLNGLLSPYNNKCVQQMEVIGKRILEHCLSYFLIGIKPPHIKVIDGDEQFNINDYFVKSLKPLSTTETINIGKHLFSLKGVKFYGGETDDHKVYYCANNREVTSKKLSKWIPDLAENSKIKDQEGNRFTYFGYISGAYFDEKVNSERTGFYIYKDTELLKEPDELSEEEIDNHVFSSLNNVLDSYLQEIKQSKDKFIREYITSEAPMYRTLLRFVPEQLEKIKPGLTKPKLDLELRKIYYQYQLDLQEKRDDIINISPEDFEKYPEYHQKYYDYLEKYNDLGKAKLAEYIVHRKIIIDIFEKNLQKGQDGKYKLEKDLHEIVFPLRETSNDVDFESQNLWLIDERLSYHKYLASDKPFKTLENMNVDSNQRPDILIFNNPLAFVESDQQPYSSVVIIEFKRPMRSGYSDSDNPITQVYDYVRKIRSGKYEDKDGRLINLPESTPFYAYIICDLTSQIKDFADDATYNPTPDLQGYFGYNSRHGVYVEILSFDKVVQDAKKRNNVLFRKLNI